MTELTRADRAAAAMRQTDEPGWAQVSDRLRDTLRQIPLPATDVRADHGESQGGQDLVSTRALRSLLRTTLVSDSHSPERLSFETDGDRLVAVEVEMTVVYGVVLPDVLQGILGRVTELLDDALGAEGARVAVHVVAADVLPEPDWESGR